MKIGKLPEQMLVRSVLKQAKHRRDEVLVGPAVGQDCAVMELGPDEVFVMSSDPITGTVKDIGSHGIHVTANDLAASGAEPVGVILTVLLPENIEEEQIRKMMQDAERTCKELNMEIMGGHTEITNVVQQPLLTVTGVGKTKKKDLLTTMQVHPGQDIVVYMEYINNVNYNWGSQMATYGGMDESQDPEHHGWSCNFVNNYYKPGPLRQPG